MSPPLLLYIPSYYHVHNYSNPRSPSSPSSQLHPFQHVSDTFLSIRRHGFCFSSHSWRILKKLGNQRVRVERLDVMQFFGQQMIVQMKWTNHNING